MQSFVLGLGGTGSRCLESLVHLCAGGLGPDHLWAGIVDPDASNGNVRRADLLLRDYRDLRAALKDPGTNNLAPDCPFLATELEVSDSGSRWSPTPQKPGVTLRDLLEYPLLGDYRGILDALFHPKDEQQMRFDVGFRGRPSVGAAVIASRALDKDPFWNNIRKAAEVAKGGEEVRFFLMGSIFGGTGASAFPNLAILIREIMAAANVQSGFSIGGALLLPYFYFPSPEEPENDVVAESAAFREQAHGALRHYHEMLKGKQVFDNLYVLGWDPLIRIPTFCSGGSGQSNPPLVPELYAALAAARFFNAEELPDGPLFLIGRDGNGASSVDWSQIPACETEPRATVKEGIGQLLRFGYAYRNVYARHLGELPSKRSVARQAWFRRLIEGSVDLGSERIGKIRGGLDRYTDELLRWAATLDYATQTDNVSIDLFDSQAIGKKVDGDLAILHGREQLDFAQFEGLVAGKPGAGLEQVLTDLCDAKPARDVKGFGGFTTSLYESCAL